jgi:hypothetical protein
MHIAMVPLDGSRGRVRVCTTDAACDSVKGEGFGGVTQRVVGFRKQRIRTLLLAVCEEANFALYWGLAVLTPKCKSQYLYSCSHDLSSPWGTSYV